MTPAIRAGTPTLREVKKERTRANIRVTALRLFLEQGYEATSVQQIAQVAEVGVTTLFRYFPTKASLALPFDLATLVRDAFEARHPDDTVFDAIHVALRMSFDELSRSGPTGAIDDQYAAHAMARARDAILAECVGVVGVFAELIGECWGRDPHDRLVQAAAGGVVGVTMAALGADRDLDRGSALAILETGLQALEIGFRP